MIKVAVLNPVSIPSDFRARVTPFLQAHGFATDCAIEPVAGGGNNRVYRVQTAGRAGLLKAYFQNPADPRDRFGAERAFYEFLWGHGVRRTPEPLGWDSAERPARISHTRKAGSGDPAYKNQSGDDVGRVPSRDGVSPFPSACEISGLGLFTFVNGRKLRAEEVTSEHVGQALDFVAELNRMRTGAEAGTLPAASEACFSVAEHLACVERRVARLEQIAPASALEREAAAFVAAELKPAWSKIRATIEGQIQPDAPLGLAGRCLSPSDFGFHNALLADDGRLRFFDFEYAGWDDPAKLACDFFCQPQVPVAFGHRENFLNQLAQALELAPAFSDRVRRLQPAYQVKWCCIMLNEFVGGDQARRDFAKGTADAEERRRIQLGKARQSLRLNAEVQ